MNQADYYHQHPQGRTGILLVNLGTPDQPTYGAVQRYLRSFLSDRRVIEIPRMLWLPLLYGVILPFRSRSSAQQYRAVWGEQGSPLLVHSQAIADQVAEYFGDDTRVALAMRYGNPNIADVLKNWEKACIRRLVVVPMYPQYAASTTATAFDAVAQALRHWRFVPELHMIQSYADHPLYIEAIKKSIEQYWSAHGRGDRLVMSFHGLPQRCLDLGDPYHCMCHKTARLVAESLGMTRDDRGQRWAIAFQSRFGRAEWLKPYLSDLLDDLADQGCRRVDVVCPGFAVDCLETIFEVGEEYAHAFHERCGGELRLIPCLNAQADHVELFRRLSLLYHPSAP